MNLYRISQTVNYGWDTYDSAIVAAETENDARNIHPSGNNSNFGGICSWSTWCEPEDVNIELIGTAVTGIEGVVLASFNAG